MVLHERRQGVETVGVVKHRDVMVDPPCYPRVGRICALFLAEVCDYYGKLIVFWEMSQHCVVVGVGDVEDEEDAGSPFLNGEQSCIFRVGRFQ